MTNEAAERLRWEIGVEYRIRLLDEALAAERRATVERIRVALLDPGTWWGKDDEEIRQRITAILDAEAQR